MIPLRVVPYSLCGKLDHKFTFDWLTSYPDCNLTLNYANSPRHFSSQDLQGGGCHFLPKWKRNQIILSFWNGWHITWDPQPERKVLYFDSQCCNQSHPNLEPLLFSRHNWHNHYLVCVVFRHILATGAYSHAPTCFSSGQLCIWHR
jgi:hypothetical protein